MTPLAAAITTALVHSLWQDTIVAAALAIVLAALRRRAASARYLAAGMALASMTLLPIVTAGLALRAQSVVTAPAGFHASGHLERDGTFYISGNLGRPAVRASVGARTITTPSWVLPIWVAGVLFFSLRLIIGGTHARRLRRHGEPADDPTRRLVLRVAAMMNIQRPIVVRIADTGPATIGWLRPIVLVPPAAMLGLSPSQLETLVAHELAHIRRHDYVVNLAQLAIETLFFYHPAVWWVSHRMRVERELCCDDVTVETCGDALEYARTLRAIARLSTRADRPALAAGSRPLLYRVQRLLGREHVSISPWPLVVAALAAIACALVSPSSLDAQARSSSSLLTSLSGTLYDPRGAPAEHTLLAIVAADGPPDASWRQTRTDADGRFGFTDLPTGRWHFTNPSTDVVEPESIDLHDGNRANLEVHMGVDETAVNMRVCADCVSDPPYVVPDAVRRAIAAAISGSDSGLYTAAEPLEGWDAFNATRHPYPAALRSAKLEGEVVLDGRIEADGTTTNVQIVQPAREEIASEALALVKALRWTPAQVRGTPVATQLHVTVEYVFD